MGTQDLVGLGIRDELDQPISFIHAASAAVGHEGELAHLKHAQQQASTGQLEENVQCVCAAVWLNAASGHHAYAECTMHAMGVAGSGAPCNRCPPP